MATNELNIDFSKYSDADLDVIITFLWDAMVNAGDWDTSANYGKIGSIVCDEVRRRMHE